MKIHYIFAVLLLAIVLLYVSASLFIYKKTDILARQDPAANVSTVLLDIVCEAKENDCIDISRKLARNKFNVNVFFDAKQAQEVKKQYLTFKNNALYCTATAEYCKDINAKLRKLGFRVKS